MFANIFKEHSQDFKGNVHGHKQSLRSTQLFRDLLNNEGINQDSIAYFYTILFRDYIPIVNLSGYQSLEASGLKIIRNDLLRFEIISLYGFYYNIMEIIETEADEMKSYYNYYKPINDLLYPYMEFEEGQLKRFKQPINLSEKEKKEILSYLWKLETNRKYKLGRYGLVREKMGFLKGNIEAELD